MEANKKEQQIRLLAERCALEIENSIGLDMETYTYCDRRRSGGNDKEQAIQSWIAWAESEVNKNK